MQITTIVVSAFCAFGMLTGAFALPRPPSGAMPAASEVVSVLAPPAADSIAQGDDPHVHHLVVESEDTLSRLLERGEVASPALLLHFQMDRSAARAAKQIRPGQSVQALTDPQGNLLSLDLPAGNERRLTIVREDERLASQTQSDNSEVLKAYGAGAIEHSLFAATDRAGIPDGIAVQIVEIFSGEIDFHRDIRRGDRFAVVYERLVSQGADRGSGRVLAASYSTGGRELIAVRFENDKGKAGYYDPTGQSMRRAFLRSPLEFSRITSRFTGSRFHPVLQRWRAHSGVDYGAPTGTAVRATADGVVDYQGWKGGYGKLVVIRHGGNRSTAYGHLEGYARGIARGTRVEQGQTIGYVGQTGLASGPHLHYEFRVGGKAINPLTATIPDAPPLQNSALAEFRPFAVLARHQLALAERIAPLEDQ
jgi:murein DD-endopeptidase MepM/ murein hydrolase activator NlpD